MKIAKIYIKDYQQFQEFELDLTYPKGHKKEGKPLDKVCLIGQSGTGKTTLLYDVIAMWNVLIAEINVFPEVSEASEERRYYLPVVDSNSSKEAKGKWEGFKVLISDFLDKKRNYLIAIGNAFDEGELAKADKLKQEMNELNTDSLNPFNHLVNTYLNPILAKFHLEINTKIEKSSDADFITVCTRNGTAILEEKWSTGLKNIIYRTIPIYVESQNDLGSYFPCNIILVDEPENSLYPDMQKKIIETYTTIAPKAQFFFATHSPIVASSFEPWEIVELKFKEDGTVYRELYYDGENHVDNYKFDPRYLRWDEILQDIFDLEYEGHELRHEKLKEFAELGGQIKAMKAANELHPDNLAAKELVNKFKKAGKLLNWEVKERS